MEESSMECGVAGFFLFTEKDKIKDIPESGELVRWIKKCEFDYVVIAYMQQRLIDPVLSLLEFMGVKKDKIIIGGEKL